MCVCVERERERETDGGGMELERGNLVGGTRWSPIFCWYRYLVAMPVIILC